MEEIAGRSDIVIAAAGHIGTLGEKAMAPGQIVIDVGMNDDGNGGFCGDADFAAAQRLCRAVTPVPGGVGTVTTALLLRHVVEAAEKSAAQPQ